MVARVFLAPVFAAGVLVAAVSTGHAQGFFAWPRDDGETIDRDAMLRPREVVRLLYRRYGLARVLDLRMLGDVYQANAVDRRGVRVILTIDGYNGDILERRTAGYEDGEALPRPPREVPGAAPLPGWPGEETRPRRALPPSVEQRPPAQRERERPAQRSAPRPQQTFQPDRLTPDRKPATAAPAPPPAPPPTEKATPAPQPSAQEHPPEPPKVVPAAPLAPAAPPVGESPAHESAPAQRTPEPLIDPKTGKPNPAAKQQGTPPPAPMDDAAKPAGETPIVPPAPFD